MTCTGFSGAEINGFFGEPTRLFMKPEKPDFFLKTLGILVSFVSSEYLFGPVELSVFDEPLAFSFRDDASVAEKLADWRRGGGELPMTRASELACDKA